MALLAFIRKCLRRAMPRPAAFISRPQSRARRAAIPCRTPVSSAHAARPRRGRLMWKPLDWRRGTLGTNQISSHGVWRQTARRAAPRLNSKGLTLWHQMPRAIQH